MDLFVCELYRDVEKAIDYSFNGKFILKFYDYLKIRDTNKVDVEKFIESSTSKNINTIVLDIDNYLDGGNDNDHKQLREAYGHIPKPEARKIRNYLNQIIEDAKMYINEKNTKKTRKVRKTDK